MAQTSEVQIKSVTWATTSAGEKHKTEKISEFYTQQF